MEYPQTSWTAWHWRSMLAGTYWVKLLYYYYVIHIVRRTSPCGL